MEMSGSGTEFVAQDLTQLQSQASLEQLGALEHHSIGMETVAGVVGPGLVEVPTSGPRAGSVNASGDTQLGENSTGQVVALFYTSHDS